MESYSEELLSLDESYAYDDDGLDSCTVVSCVGRGLNMINISEIKMPADYYAAVQPAIQSVRISPMPKRSSGKGRAQIIAEDRIKYVRPGGNHMPNGNNLRGGNSVPVGGDYKSGGTGMNVENCLSLRTEAQNEEDFPPLSSHKSSVASNKPDTRLTSLNRQGQPDSLEAIAKAFLAAPNV